MDRRRELDVPLQVQAEREGAAYKFRRREVEREVYGHTSELKTISRTEMRHRLNVLIEQAEDLAIDLNDLVKTYSPFNKEQATRLRESRGTARAVQKYLELAADACDPEEAD